MAEVNLLDQFPRAKRSVEDRTKVTEADRQISRQFGPEYFDGDRRQGYGGYRYEPRFWQPTVRRLAEYYRLSEGASILDVGCAKGFLLYDFKQLMPGVTVAGLDISQYALDHAPAEVRPFLRLGNAKELPYGDKSFDLVLSLNTIHNLPLDQCKQALREIQRVSRAHAFIVVDAWRTEEEHQRLQQWVLTAQTYMHVDDWGKLFREVGYTGDYFWFIVE
jgi:SAM-dependent methyltransferase